MADAARVGTLLAEPHHDGSDAYVLERPDELGGEAVVRLRVPRGAADDGRAPLRPRRRAARRRGRDRRGDGDRDLVARALPGLEPRDVATAGCSPAARPATRWLNGAGRRRRTTSPDADDFVLSLDPGGPGLAPRARSSTRSSPTGSPRAGSASRRPTGRSGAPWDELPTGRGRQTPHEWYGGDLRGDRAAPRPRRAARRERHLPDADLPGRQHAPLRRDDVRPRRPAARRRRGARLADARRARARACASSAT